MFPRLVLPIVLLLALVSSTVPGDDEDWLYREPVRYAENHDPSMVWLEDGAQLQVRYGRIPWKEVEAWPAGKELFVAYQPKTGAVLQDPTSGRHIPVIAGLETHPIDTLLERDVAKNSSTLGMVSAIGDATARWDHELNRSYREVQRISASSGLPRLRATPSPGNRLPRPPPRPGTRRS